MPPEYAIKGDYRSNGQPCSDEHETKKQKKQMPDDDNCSRSFVDGFWQVSMDRRLE